ncbi:MAG: NUDIX hydrolase [Dehalococcoidia bacterium]
MEEQILSSETIYKGKVLNLRIDSVRFPSGREGKREIVEHRDAVTLLPIDADGRLLLIRQFRLAAGQVLLEAPAGIVDPGESPKETAHRELREETGFDCRTLEPLLRFYPAPGFSEEFMHSFVASDLFESTADPDDDENIELARYSLDEAVELIATGEIIDAKTICVVLAYKLRLHTARSGAD